MGKLRASERTGKRNQPGTAARHGSREIHPFPDWKRRKFSDFRGRHPVSCPAGGGPAYQGRGSGVGRQFFFSGTGRRGMRDGTVRRNGFRNQCL